MTLSLPDLVFVVAVVLFVAAQVAAEYFAAIVAEKVADAEYQLGDGIAAPEFASKGGNPVRAGFCL